MYAVIRTGSKQHRVEKGERLKVERLDGDIGAELKLSDVLLIGGDGAPKIGRPIVNGANVTAKIVAQSKSRKVDVFKATAKGYRRMLGHRQPFTELEITGIEG